MIEQGIMSHAETNGNIKLCLLLVEKSGLCDGIAHGFKFMGMKLILLGDTRRFLRDAGGTG